MMWAVRLGFTFWKTNSSRINMASIQTVPQVNTISPLPHEPVFSNDTNDATVDIPLGGAKVSSYTFITCFLFCEDSALSLFYSNPCTSGFCLRSPQWMIFLNLPGVEAKGERASGQGARAPEEREGICLYSLSDWDAVHSVTTVRYFVWQYLYKFVV